MADKIITEGFVLRERPVGEQDKFIDILTKESGVIELCVKGARKINAKAGSSAQLFAYSRFSAARRKGRLYLDSAEPIHIFYGLRSELSRIALASYFAEVLSYSVPEETDCGNVLRLLLNCLHFLENGTRSEAQLRSIFELRLMAETGFMPDIIACRSCGEFEPNDLYFCVKDGGLLCTDCYEDDESGEWLHINLPVLRAVRHIVLADFSRLFNFRLSDTAQDKLTELTERYLTTHIERTFRTLEFYNEVSN